MMMIFLNNFSSRATHIIGGEISYQYLSENKYRCTLFLYRDCSNENNAEFDTMAYISIYDMDNTFIDTFLLSKPVITNINPELNNPCLNVPDNVCVQQAAYLADISLGQQKGYYTLTYQTCCRNSTVENILLPDNTGSTYSIQIPDRDDAPVNSSAVFHELPPIVLCNNVSLEFNHSAIDADGDSLVYSLATPYGSPSSSFNESIAHPPPYELVNWLYPYSQNEPIKTDPPLHIDPVTGLITGTPNTMGQFVVAVSVSEFRNGKLLSSNKRDFQFNITDCNSSEINITANAFPSCNYTTISFSKTSIYDKDIILYLSLADSLKNGIGIYIPDSIIIEAGQSGYQLEIDAYSDNYEDILNSISITSNFDSICSKIISPEISIIYPQELSIVPTNNEIVICRGETATLTTTAIGGEGSYSYAWNTSENEKIIQVSPNNNTSYFVTVTDSCGNAIDEEIKVYVICEVEIPNVFTPDGDGKNDVFQIGNLEDHPGSDLKIYDRWGKLIFKSRNYDNNWDGNILPEGTYYYILSLREKPAYKANEKRGFISILK
jgi:gliding motility-associated-like protein